MKTKNIDRDMTFSLLKKYYSDLYKGDQFDNRKAHQFLNGFANKTLRVQHINDIYNMFLRSCMISSESKLYISTGLSTTQVAEKVIRERGMEYSEKMITSIKNKILHENQVYTNIFEIETSTGVKRNIVNMILTYPNIDDNLWRKIDGIIIRIYGESTISYLNNNYCIHFPKVSFSGKINDKKLDELLELIKPYNNTIKKEFERSLKNEYSDEVVYLSYILNPDSDLNKADRERLNSIKEGFNIKDIKEFITSRKTSDKNNEASEDIVCQDRNVRINTNYDLTTEGKIYELEDEADKLKNEICIELFNALDIYNQQLSEDKAQARLLFNQSMMNILKRIKGTSFKNYKLFNELITNKRKIEDFIDTKVHKKEQDEQLIKTNHQQF